MNDSCKGYIFKTISLDYKYNYDFKWSPFTIYATATKMKNSKILKAKFTLQLQVRVKELLFKKIYDNLSMLNNQILLT